MKHYGIWIPDGINTAASGRWLEDEDGTIFFTVDIGVARAQKRAADHRAQVREFNIDGTPGEPIFDHQKGIETENQK